MPDINWLLSLISNCEMITIFYFTLLIFITIKKNKINHQLNRFSDMYPILEPIYAIHKSPIFLNNLTYSPFFTFK